MKKLIDIEVNTFRSYIYEEIDKERVKQNKLYGGAIHDDSHNSWEWIALLSKHVGKALVWPFDKKWKIFRYQMIRVAATATTAIEWIDRNKNRCGTHKIEK